MMSDSAQRSKRLPAQTTDPCQDLLKLYFFPGTRAVRARWMIEELGLPYELCLVDLRQGANRSDEYLAVHPLGKVPALDIDGRVIFESLAICLYLADRHWEHDLAPVPEERALRAEYYKWMALSVGTLEPAILEQSRLEKAKEKNIELICLGPALTSFQNVASYIDQTLAHQPFLLGENFSAADVMNGSLMMWAGEMGLLASFQHVAAWIEWLRARPAYLRATQTVD